jgi:hypothetical protein
MLFAAASRRVAGEKVGAEHFRLMPAKGIFTLGVGMCAGRRSSPGARRRCRRRWRRCTQRSERARVDCLAGAETRVYAGGDQASPWSARAAEAGVSLEEFCRIAESLNGRKVVGRFSTFLEHVKPSAGGVRVTRFNALFHWAVPPGRELEAGGEVGRHHILTHCYWRERVRSSKRATSWPSRTAPISSSC